MDFLSDTARKEKRSLLATGSVGILVAWLGVDQTEIELAGFKFHNVNLPALIAWSLLAVITYFLAKFCLSYFYERFNSEMELYAAQLSEGKTAMDISREEKEILEGSRLLIEQQRVYQAQRENEKERIAELQSTTQKNDGHHETALKSLDLQSTELQEALAKATGSFRVRIPSMNISMDHGAVRQKITEVEKRKSAVVVDRQNARLKELEYLNDEKNRSEGNEKARQIELVKAMEALDLKRKSVSSWRQAHKGATIVGPLHLFTDVGLPIVIGLTAIGLLSWFLFHLPSPPLPIPIYSTEF